MPLNIQRYLSNHSYTLHHHRLWKTCRCPTCRGRNVTPVEHLVSVGRGWTAAAAPRLLAACRAARREAAVATAAPVVSPRPLPRAPVTTAGGGVT